MEKYAQLMDIIFQRAFKIGKYNIDNTLLKLQHGLNGEVLDEADIITVSSDEAFEND